MPGTTGPEPARPFDRLIAGTDPAMVVVTTVADGERAGCLVGFHGQAGIGPEHYAVWISRANRTSTVAQRAAVLAVHFLTEEDHALAAHFGSETGEVVDKFSGVTWSPGRHHVPLLGDCPHHLVLERVALVDVDAVDHSCWLGRVVEARGGRAFVPLRLSQVQDLDSGHPAEEGGRG
ncbi:flavin reductase family protein [Marmoricola sp. RAF53]|uniref:flavin reductase family protein n=1 Tax=Marmoricola sp. RAF53 TaxID=3233059 RepID=UPI003F970C82